MGQAQKSGQRNVQYRDVELELWELDTDDYSDGYARRPRRSSGDRARSGGRDRAGSSRGSGGRDNRSRGADTKGGVTLIGGIDRIGGGMTGARNRRNIPRCEQRSKRGDIRQASRRQPQRELQIQDIRRFQTSGVENRSGARSVYRGSARPVQSINRRRARRRKVYMARAAMLTLIVLCLVGIYFMTGELYRLMYDKQNHDGGSVRSDRGIIGTLSEQPSGDRVAPPELIEDYLEVNDYSRPGTPIGKIKNIFVHYTANPGTSAAQNRSYFANLALTQERSASAHLIIGYDGEVIQCIPFDEQAYAVMTRNEDSISIECCYTSEDGSFTQETYDTLVHTLAWLIDQYDLSVEDILRHYDCGGKMCPVYYVEHEEAWEQLLWDVATYEDDGGEDA